MRKKSYQKWPHFRLRSWFSRHQFQSNSKNIKIKVPSFHSLCGKISAEKISVYLIGSEIYNFFSELYQYKRISASVNQCKMRLRENKVGSIFYQLQLCLHIAQMWLTIDFLSLIHFHSPELFPVFFLNCTTRPLLNHPFSLRMPDNFC